MPDTCSVRLGGLWKATTSKGKHLLEGKVKHADVLAALEKVSPTKLDIQVTIWLNSEEDKRMASSPDASLVFAEKYVKTPLVIEDDAVPF